MAYWAVRKGLSKPQHRHRAGHLYLHVHVSGQSVASRLDAIRQCTLQHATRWHWHDYGNDIIRDGSAAITSMPPILMSTTVREPVPTLLSTILMNHSRRASVCALIQCSLVRTWPSCYPSCKLWDRAVASNAAAQSVGHISDVEAVVAPL